MIAELLPSPNRTTLRPYQELAIEHVQRAVDKHQRVYFNLPTGCGKTVVLSALTERYDRAVLVAHRKELIEQIAGRLRSDWDRSVGIVMGSRNEPDAELVVGTEQSLRPDRLNAILQEPVDALFIDECFPAGTLVDGTPIQDWKAGMPITAWDETRGATVSHVVRTMSRPAPQYLVEVEAGEQRVVCTPNHPFLTDRGWVPSGNLREGDILAMLKGGSHAGQGAGCRRMHGMRQDHRIAGATSAAAVFPQQQSILLGSMQGNMGTSGPVTAHVTDKPEVRIGPHEDSQSDAFPRVSIEDVTDASRHWTQARDTRRQWSRSHDTGATLGGSIRMANASYCANQNGTTERRLSDSLQTGYRESCRQNLRRGGWRFSFGGSQTRTGQTQAAFPDCARVDRLTIREPGSDGTFGGLCPDGRVYNLEVAEQHTFIAEGFIVHNCHHAVPNSHYAKIAERMWEANPDLHVIGCTATPYRADKRRMQDFLPVCAFSRTIDQMQTEGWLCPFTWHTVQVDWNLAAIGTRTVDGEQDYDLRELAAEAEDEATVDAIVEHTAHLLGDRPTCVFGVSVEHAKMLADGYNRAGFRAAVVWGTMPKDDRKAILRLWQEGWYQIVCNMGILTEGFDFPGIQAVVMARPTRSQSLYVQCVGRGSRLAPGKADCIVIDVAGNGEIDDTLQILLPDVASVEEPEDDEGTARQGQLSGMRRQRIARDPSMDRTYRWLAEEGHYALSASDGIILVMVEDPNGSGLYQLGALRNDGAVARVSRQPDPIWEQYRVAQSWLETNSVKALAGREQPWHAKPASEKQLWLLRKLDAAAAIPGMSRRQAAEAITSAMVRKHYPRLRYHLWGVRP